MVGGKMEGRRKMTNVGSTAANVADGADARSAHLVERRSVFGRARQWLARSSFTLACAFSGCPVVIGGDAGRDASGDAADAVVACEDDEALDQAYDQSLGIDCTAVRAAIALRRKPDQQAAVDAALRAHRRVRRCCVSRQTLVQWLRTPAELGGPTEPDAVRAVDRAIGMSLCDPLTREARTHNWLAEHSTCFIGVAPLSSDVAGGAR